MLDQKMVDKMRQNLKDGIKVVVAPQLYPTPKWLAEKMADYLDIYSTATVLEPSAGTGALIDAVIECGEFHHIHAYELNYSLCQALQQKYPTDTCLTSNCDFLSIAPHESYERIIMNPPFAKGDDIKHIKHALKFLKPDGNLVALCANGPRQEKELQSLCDHWEVLPEGTFKNAGTMVNTALLVIRK